MQFLQQLVDVVFQELNLLISLHQFLLQIVSITCHWAAAAGRLPPYLLHWTLFLESTHTFNGPLSKTTQVSQYQKGK